MPSYLVSLPGARTSASGVPLGSKLNHMSVSAVYGNTKKPFATASNPVLGAAHGAVSAPTHVVSKAKTY